MSRCCKYSSGMMRTPITMQRATKASDGAGGYTETWATIIGSPSRAHVEQRSGNEVFASDRVEATRQVRVVVRYFSGLREGDRVVIDGKAYNIRAINNVEFRNRWLEIDAQGGVAT